MAEKVPDSDIGKRDLSARSSAWLKDNEGGSIRVSCAGIARGVRRRIGMLGVPHEKFASHGYLHSHIGKFDRGAAQPRPSGCRPCTGRQNSGGGALRYVHDGFPNGRAESGVDWDHSSRHEVQPVGHPTIPEMCTIPSSFHPVRFLIDNVAANHCHQCTDVADSNLFHSQRVGTQHCEIGESAGLKGAFLSFVEA